MATRPIPKIAAATVAIKRRCVTDRERSGGSFRPGGGQCVAVLADRSRMISLMGCGVVRAVPSALVGINLIEKSARKGLLCIAFSSAGTPCSGLSRTNYVTEDGVTQMVNCCALFAGFAGLRQPPAVRRR